MPREVEIDLYLKGSCLKVLKESGVVNYTDVLNLISDVIKEPELLDKKYEQDFKLSAPLESLITLPANVLGFRLKGTKKKVSSINYSTKTVKCE